MRTLHAACCMLHFFLLIGQRAEQIGHKSLAALQFLDSQSSFADVISRLQAEWMVNNPPFLHKQVCGNKLVGLSATDGEGASWFRFSSKYSYCGYGWGETPLPGGKNTTIHRPQAHP